MTQNFDKALHAALNEGRVTTVIRLVETGVIPVDPAKSKRENIENILTDIEWGIGMDVEVANHWLCVFHMPVPKVLDRSMLLKRRWWSGGLFIENIAGRWWQNYYRIELGRYEFAPCTDAEVCEYESTDFNDGGWEAATKGCNHA